MTDLWQDLIYQELRPIWTATRPPSSTSDQSTSLTLERAHYPGVAFTREGKFYLAEYPLFSWSVARLYRWIFPFALVAAVVLKLVSEYRLPSATILPLVVDTLLCALIVAASVMYFLHVNIGK